MQCIRTNQFKSSKKKQKRASHDLGIFISLAAASGAAYGLYRLYRYFLPPIPKRMQKVYPYALLLGCPCRKDGTPSTSQMNRCKAAADAYDQGMYQTLILSGGAVKTVQPESEQLEAIIHEMNPDLPVILESNAKNTWQNLEFASEIAKGKPILIITSDLHARRAAAMARNFFSTFTFYTCPDRKPRHIAREIVSRLVYVRLELEKKWKRWLHLFKITNSMSLS